MNDELRIFAGRSNPDLTDEICQCLDIERSRVTISRFSNDNLSVQIDENVRERDTFVVQAFTEPASDRILELLITLDALRSASARRITAVIPYFSYARSDKKDAPRISIAGRLIADLLRTAGAHRVLTNKYYVDELYDATVVRGTMGSAGGLWTVDRNVVDGAVNGTGWTTIAASWVSHVLDKYVVDGLVNLTAWICGEASYVFRRAQSGLIQNYAFVTLLGVFAFVTWYLVAR